MWQLSGQAGGVQVDVGSVDGFSFSNTYFLERNLNWTGVCVEPHAAHLPSLTRLRPVPPPELDPPLPQTPYLPYPPPSLDARQGLLLVFFFFEAGTP